LKTLKWDGIQVTGPKEVFVIRYAGLNMEYAAHGIIDRMSPWLWGKHPIIS